MNKKPRILVISPTYPYPLVSGGKLRIYHILKSLSDSFEITLVSLTETGDFGDDSIEALSFIKEILPVPIKQNRFNQIGRMLINLPFWVFGTPAEVIMKRSSSMKKLLRRVIESGDFDCVQIEYVQCIQYLDSLRGIEIPKILVEHDISYISQERKSSVVNSFFGSFFWKREARIMKCYERAAWESFQLITTMSENDRSHIQSHLPSANLNVIPNGVDVEGINVYAESSVPTLVFVGWMRHLPNKDAVSWFVRKIWPLIKKTNKEVMFKIVGKGLSGSLAKEIESDPRISYLGYVEDIHTCVGKSWISVVPLRIGSGTRLKILESMALGTPVVTTTLGCEGINAQPNQHALFADTEEEFSHSILELLSSPERRKLLGYAGRELVEEQYNWTHIGESAAKAIHDVFNV